MYTILHFWPHPTFFVCLFCIHTFATQDMRKNYSARDVNQIQKSNEKPEKVDSYSFGVTIVQNVGLLPIKNKCT